MTGPSQIVWSTRSGRRDRTTRGGPRRPRHRLTPEAETLEGRDCPSSWSASPGIDRLAHAALVAHRDGPEVRRIHPIPHGGTDTAHPLKRKTTAGPQTIYVKPGGKLGARAGKTPARPLGSLVVAIKRAKPGSTIILAPGVYTENAAVANKSNLTIIGAGEQSTILAPTSNDAIKVVSSSNIIIENLWFRSGGRGLSIVGSSVTLQDIRTDGTFGDGVVAAQGSTLNVTSCQFDSVQTGDGLHLEDDASAIINGSTFNNDGTAPDVSTASNGLVLDGGATANIVNSQFIGNTNSGLVASGTSQVTATGSTFSSNHKGDGAIFFGQTSANLTGNTFASNGEVIGPTTGLNGLEFFTDFTGTATVSGNIFRDNTGNGLFIGSSPNTIQVVNNAFDDNFVGITMDSTTGSTIRATVQGNTISVPVGTAAGGNVGILATGGGVAATIGGPGAQANTIENYAASALNGGTFIYVADGDTPGQDTGCPTLVNLPENTFTLAGSPVPEAAAIRPC